MIWDNNSIFRTNCAIAYLTRAYMLRGFLRVSRGEMPSEIPEIFHVFGPQLNACTSVGIFLKYFRRKFFQFEWSKTVSNLGMFRFKLIYIADQVVFRRRICCSISAQKIKKEIFVKICWQLKTPTRTWKCTSCTMQMSCTRQTFPSKTLANSPNKHKQ